MVRGLTVQRSRLIAENPFLWACHRAMGNTSFIVGYFCIAEYGV